MTTTPPTGLLRASVHLADWLANATPAEVDTVTQWVDQMRPGWIDQIDAAAQHARTAVPLTAPAASEPMRAVPPGQTPEWLQLSIAEAITLYIAGRARTCLHADPNRPQPVFAAAWKPGLITCLRCLPLFRCTSAEDDLRCDQCGTVDHEVFPCRIVAGLLIYAWGLCPPCRDNWADVLGIPA